MNRYNLRRFNVGVLDSSIRNSQMQIRVMDRIRNSWSKTEKMITKRNTMYKKLKSIRPFLLTIIRYYDVIKHDWRYVNFLQTAYKKSIKWTKDIDSELLQQHSLKEENYIKSFRKNLVKIKKMCEDTSVAYYSLLPDRFNNDVRTHCVQFISQATINE